MTEYTVEISKKAAEDMEEIYTYIANHIGMPQTAIDQFNDIADGIESLSTFPARTKIISGDYCKQHELRQLLVNNYSVIFTIKDKTVYVIRVLYSASDIIGKLQKL